MLEPLVPIVAIVHGFSSRRTFPRRTRRGPPEQSQRRAPSASWPAALRQPSSPVRSRGTSQTPCPRKLAPTYRLSIGGTARVAYLRQKQESASPTFRQSDGGSRCDSKTAWQTESTSAPARGFEPPLERAPKSVDGRCPPAHFAQMPRYANGLPSRRLASPPQQPDRPRARR